MARVSNIKCRPFVEALKPFTGHNLSGEWRGPRFYVVLSYGWWPLFIWDKKAGTWYENEERYSVSTSKQRGQAAPLCCDYVALSHANMKALLDEA